MLLEGEFEIEVSGFGVDDILCDELNLIVWMIVYVFVDVG